MAKASTGRPAPRLHLTGFRGLCPLRLPTNVLRGVRKLETLIHVVHCCHHGPPGHQVESSNTIDGDSPRLVGKLSHQHQRSNIAISPRLGQTDQAPARSQRGPVASILFFTALVSVATRFDPECFRVLLLRRLWCHLPFVVCHLPVWPTT